MKFGLYTFIIENAMKKYYKKNPLLKSHIYGGWGNGYILLPKEHPFYNIDYNKIFVNIHGGLTFGQIFTIDNFFEWVDNKEIGGDMTLDNYKNFDGYYMIGFDTNHYGDTLHNCTKEYVINETENLLKQCLNDDVEKIRKYKYKYYRKLKLEKINGVKGLSED